MRHRLATDNFPTIAIDFLEGFPRVKLFHTGFHSIHISDKSASGHALSSFQPNILTKSSDSFPHSTTTRNNKQKRERK